MKDGKIKSDPMKKKKTKEKKIRDGFERIPMLPLEGMMQDARHEAAPNPFLECIVTHTCNTV